MTATKASSGVGGTDGVTPGTSGNVLTSDGTNWTSAAASGGAWTLIESQTASADATLDFVTGIDSTYAKYVFIGTELLLNTGGGIDILASVDGGSNWLSTGYDRTSFLHDAATYGGYRVSAQSSWDPFSNYEVASDNLTSFTLELFGPSNATTRKVFRSVFMGMSSGDVAAEMISVLGHSTTSAINGIRFDAAGGAATITSGRISLFGIKHT
jgi:hypothetical protein